jgi:hypothetical protein
MPRKKLIHTNSTSQGHVKTRQNGACGAVSVTETSQTVMLLWMYVLGGSGFPSIEKPLKKNKQEH